MQSTLINFVEITSKLKQQWDIKQSCEFIVVDTQNKDSVADLQFNVKPQLQLNIYVYVLNDNRDKQFNIHINHQNNSKSEVVVKTLGAHRSHTHINIVSLIEKDALHVTSNESIDGILLDDTAEIKVLPSMLIDGNSMKASHSVNIGNINPEQLFYLMSRSCSKNEATKILLNAMFHKIKSNEHKSAIRLYNNINEALNKLLEPTHAN